MLAMTTTHDIPNAGRPCGIALALVLRRRL
jgi:hypothetical protein